MRAALPSIRSLLFVPGNRPERFEKARAAEPDAVCIDLEDAVPPGAKAEARHAANTYLKAGPDGGPVMGLRVNGLRTAEGLADLAVLAQSGARPAFLMLPKTSHGEEPAIVAAALSGQCPSLIPIIESALGLSQAYAIASAPQVAALLFGGADFSTDIGASLDWEPMLHARSTLVAAAASAAIQLIDVPYLDVENEAGLIAETKRARALGMTGRACIHPKQVPGVHAAFTPSEQDVRQARRLLEAFDAARGGAALLDGKLIDLPLAVAARRVLQRAPA